MSKEDTIEASRRALLQYYSSQTMTHGGYIIALVIGALTLISKWDVFFRDATMPFVFFFILSGITGIGFNVVGRTLYWSCLSITILHATTNSNDLKNTTIFQLSSDAGNKVLDAKKLAFLWRVACWFTQSRPQYAIAMTIVVFSYLMSCFFASFDGSLISTLFVLALIIWKIQSMYK
jgi:hypothetical protein